MQNRIDACFQALRDRQEKAFIAYICAGDPSLGRTVELALALEQAGTDILELGIPFSDPLADGIVNQLAAQRALEAGASVPGIIDCVRQIRQRSQIPIVLYTYMNPIFQFGFERFHHDANKAGVDGLLILDLPPEEDFGTQSEAVLHIRLIAPTTPPARVKNICDRAAGFIYYVSHEGVTGAQRSVASSLAEHVEQIRLYTDLPIVVGFGISNAKQAREAARSADGIVVGSAIVQQIQAEGTAPDMPRKIGEFVEALVAATKDAPEALL